jgi:NAD(P)-dependent dehydrogenase (short-subunit alcohol dehydrogenase family)
MGEMKGQVAVVTGGTRGIGLAISERLLNRGVTVAAGYATRHDHAREFADKYADRGVSVHQGNVGHNEDVLRVFGEVLDRHGHVDILVNNAGITIDKMVRKMAPEEWDHVIHVNLSGAFYASRAVLQHMLDRGYGRIINISSIIGSAGGFGQANYAAAKSGLFGLTMSLALETAGKGITVNTVTPGFIATDMTAATAERVGVSFDVFQKAAAERIPVRRIGQPSDVANTISFLVSDGAGFVSGQVIYVSGGPLC